MRAISGRNAICRAISLPSPTLAPVINTVFSGVVLIEFLSRLKVQPGLPEWRGQAAEQTTLCAAWSGPAQRLLAFRRRGPQVGTWLECMCHYYRGRLECQSHSCRYTASDV